MDLYSLANMTCLQEGSKESEVAYLAEELYHKLNSVDCFRNDVIIDNRYNMTIGRRLFEARRIGYPFVVVIGHKALQPVPEFEVHHILMHKEISVNESATIQYLKECLLNK
jgi:prolyl-tRNA synthetase